MDEIARLEAAIAALQAQRVAIGDPVFEATVAPLRERIAALRAGSEPTQSLRQVTILFLDVVGSTALSSGLDPEEIHVVVDGALTVLTGVVEAHGGRVLQYAGDSLLAVFGADRTTEDDTERAVHCGLALVEAARPLAESVRARHGIAGFSVRVGVHTGRVLLGAGVDPEHAIRGVPVHVAARMEQSAPVGSLRISRDSWRHVRGLFDAVEEVITVKGVNEPMRTYVVQRARPRAPRAAPRGVEGISTPMIGRDGEFAELRRALEELLTEGRLAARVVVGEAGLGKTRLVSEFEGWAAARPRRIVCLSGGALPQTRSQPYGLLRDLLTRQLGISDSDAAAVAREKFIAGVREGARAGAAPDAALLGHLIGLDFSADPPVANVAGDTQQLRARGLQVAVDWLRRMARTAPLLMLLEDLHWSDDASLDALEHLLGAAADVPLLIVATTRPSLFERRDDLARGQWERVEIAPLSDPQRNEFADALLHRVDAAPPALRALITGSADGNPFYMEELLKMLIDDGAVVTDDERWRVVPERLHASHVPTTLAGVLQARVDTLANRDRLVLQQAAVLGVVFWDLALAALTGRDAPDAGALALLESREFIRRHATSAFAGTGEYVFKHQLMQQVAYEGVLKALRSDWHSRAADWIATQTGERAGEHLATAAEHYDRAGDARRASEHHERAAAWAAVRGAHRSMLRSVERGLALAAADDFALRWRLIGHRERFNVTSDDRLAHAADLDALEAIAEASDDNAKRADVLWRRAYALDDAGDRTAAIDLSRRSLELALAAGSDRLAAQAYAGLGYELMRVGDFDGARQAVEAGLALARAHGLRGMEPHLLTNAGGIARAQGDHGAALGHFAAALAITRELGHRTNEAVMLNNLGDTALRVGDHAAAREHLLASVEVARATGVRTMEGLALQNLAAVAHQQGYDEEALARANEALELQRAMGQRHNAGISLNILGDAALALGREAEAHQAYIAACELFASLGDGPLEMESVAGLVRTALARGDISQGLADAQRVLDFRAQGRGLEGSEQPLRILASVWQALRAAGDPRATAVLREAQDELRVQASHVADPRLRALLTDAVPWHRQIATGT